MSLFPVNGFFEDFGGVRLVFKDTGKMLMVPSSPWIPNEPKNTDIAAGYLAKIKAIPAEEVIEVSTRNALKASSKLRNFLRTQT